MNDIRMTKQMFPVRIERSVNVSIVYATKDSELEHDIKSMVVLKVSLLCTDWLSAYQIAEFFLYFNQYTVKLGMLSQG